MRLGDLKPLLSISGRLQGWIGQVEPEAGGGGLWPQQRGAF